MVTACVRAYQYVTPLSHTTHAHCGKNLYCHSHIILNTHKTCSSSFCCAHTHTQFEYTHTFSSQGSMSNMGLLGNFSAAEEVSSHVIFPLLPFSWCCGSVCLPSCGGKWPFSNSNVCEPHVPTLFNAICQLDLAYSCVQVETCWYYSSARRKFRRLLKSFWVIVFFGRKKRKEPI